MPLPRTSKEKSARIDWGYVQRPSRLARVRGWLWALAALLVAAPLTAATVAAGLTNSPPGPLAAAASPGPLASPHAAWDAKCEACHTPFTAIRSGAVTGQCESCHKPANHHVNQKPASVAGCADCHRDHQGRTASLVRLADEACVRCHGALPDHWLMPSKLGTAERVTSFSRPDGHPEFRTADQARTLKFSHATHMTKGMGIGTGWAFTKIADEAERKRYLDLLGQTDPAAAVQLDCKACHQLEADGRTFKPTTFDAHCRACHPLTFDLPVLSRVQAPHPVQPNELDRFLRRVYTERFVADEWKAQPGPDRGPGRLDPPPAVVAAVKGKIDKAVESARQTLLAGRTTCLECHFAEFPAVGPRLPTKIKSVTASARPKPHVRFDHTAHRAMDCRHCHPGASADKKTESAATNRMGDPDAVYQHKLDLPGAANCRECHSPAGGVRHGCTDCHQYHSSGPGRPTRTWNAADWLRGSVTP